MDRAQIAESKTMSHALRHAPWLYELGLDEEGWVPMADLLVALRGHRERWTGRDDIEQMVRRSAKQRFERDADRIRARYGHSVPGRLARSPAHPPARLYHGTSPCAVEVIVREGLRPMGRQYVHLSTDVETAEQVVRRTPTTPVVLRVAAVEAAGAGIAFHQSNDHVWLADAVPGRFLEPLAG